MRFGKVNLEGLKMGIPVYVMEEHSEAFYCWNYMVAVGEIAPTGNHLFHLDSHSDFDAGYYNFNLNQLPFPLEKVIKLVSSNDVGIGDFIAPSIYQGIFDSVFFVSLDQDSAHERTAVKDSFVECVRGTELGIFDEPDETKKKALFDTINESKGDIRHFTYFEGGLEAFLQTALTNDTVVLDVDLDAFCADNLLSTAGVVHIEVTKEYYDDFLNNTFHPLRLMAKANSFSAIEKNGRYYIRINGNIGTNQLPQRPVRGAIEKKLDCFFDFLKTTQLKVVAVDICRSRFSGYLPRTIFPWIENEFLKRLSALYDIDIKVRPDFVYPSILDKYVTYRQDILAGISVSMQKQIGEYWLMDISRRCQTLLGWADIREINSFYQKYAIPAYTFAYRLEIPLCGDRWLKAGVEYYSDSFLHYDSICNAKNNEGECLQKYVQGVLNEGVDINMTKIGIEKTFIGEGDGDRSYSFSMDSGKNLQTLFEIFRYPVDIEQVKKILPLPVVVLGSVTVSSLNGTMPVKISFRIDAKQVKTIAEFLEQQFGAKFTDSLIRQFIRVRESDAAEMEVQLELTEQGTWGKDFTCKLIVKDTVSPQRGSEFLESNEMRATVESLLAMGVVDERLAESIAVNWDGKISFDERGDREIHSMVQAFTLSWKGGKWQPATITLGVKTE